MNSDPLYTAYPLYWPAGWPRTKPWARSLARFADRSLAKAREFVLDELRMLGARDPVISTNVSLRKDGLPRSIQAQPDDPGVAVYFSLGSKSRVLACDKWTLVEDNLWAIGLHIESIRGQQRWGVGTLDQAFTEYAALPTPAAQWWEVLAVRKDATEEEARAAYRQLARLHHPDSGGNQEQFIRVQTAWEQAQKERGWKGKP